MREENNFKNMYYLNLFGLYLRQIHWLSRNTKTNLISIHSRYYKGYRYQQYSKRII